MTSMIIYMHNPSPVAIYYVARSTRKYGHNSRCMMAWQGQMSDLINCRIYSLTVRAISIVLSAVYAIFLTTGHQEV